jgi:hypothetical protein
MTKASISWKFITRSSLGTDIYERGSDSMTSSDITSQPAGNNRSRYLGALVPLLAFGSTLTGIALWNAGMQFEIQYAAFGGLLASCLLA